MTWGPLPSRAGIADLAIEHGSAKPAPHTNTHSAFFVMVHPRKCDRALRDIVRKQHHLYVTLDLAQPPRHQQPCSP
jgi:hypothetical protein